MEVYVRNRETAGRGITVGPGRGVYLFPSLADTVVTGEMGILKAHLKKNVSMIRHEAEHAEGFMRVLMKPRNSRDKWTKEEKVLLRNYLRRLAVYVPALLVFLLPFGMLLIPVLAEILDRRKVKRDRIQ